MVKPVSQEATQAEVVDAALCGPRAHSVFVNSFFNNGPVQSLLASVSAPVLLPSTSIPAQSLMQSWLKLMKMLLQLR